MVDVIFCQRDVLYVVEALYVVGLNIGREDGEAVLGVHVVVELAHVDAGHFYLVARPGDVDQVGQEHDFFLPRHSAGGD